VPFLSSHGLATVAEISSLIIDGRILLLAGDETLLANLPAGTWIAATCGNFMTAKSGTARGGLIFYTDLTEDAESVTIERLDATALPGLAAKYPANGFALLIVPGMSSLLQDFAQNAADYKDIYTSPLAGWVSAVDHTTSPSAVPKIFARTAEGFTDHAAIMYVALPDTKIARLDIINLFSPNKSVALEFDENGFAATNCRINGRITNLYSYLAEQNIDIKLPLIADYNGALLNVAIKTVDSGTGTVTFYGPVFKNIVYRFADPLPDYAAAFQDALAEAADATPVACWNNILNFLYAGLEGKSTAPFFGPTSFGEIAYTLLNQTLVYLTIDTLDE
jgi:hypothetical protein